MTAPSNILHSLTGAANRGFLKFKRRGHAVPRSGEHIMPELEAEAEVFVDRWGVPHIYARTLHDLFFLNGYTQAWDRLWQMDFTRRAASGRLAEALGPDLLPIDRFTRRLGFRRLAEASASSLDATSALVIDPYVAGINAYITHATRAPIEFELAGYPPEPWERADVLALGMLLPFTLTPNWDLEIIRSLLLQDLPPEAVAAAELNFDGDYGSASTPASPAGRLDAQGSALGEFKRLTGLLQGGAGSNAWAVAGSRTTTGKPILAGDPHLQAGLPNIWHQLHLSCGELEVIGASIPGMPGVTIGHNRHVAWSVTAGMVDVADLFEDEGEGELLREEILVSGGDSYVEDVFVGANGPDIAPALGIGDRRLCLKTAPVGDNLGALLLGVARAHDWDSFRDALRGWSSPVLNFVYADTAGNIGYQLAGLVPLRDGESRGLLPNRAGAGGWTGFVPFDELPTVYNPKCGYVVSANDRVAGADYPHWLGIDFLDDSRARRISQLIESREQHSPLGVSQMQMDDLSLLGSRLVEALAGFEAAADDTAWALSQLRFWDHRLNAMSRAPALYAAFVRAMSRRIGAAYFGRHVEYWLGFSINPLSDENGWAFNRTARLVQLLKERPDDCFGDWDSEIEGALNDAVRTLADSLGPDREQWRYGRLHQLTLKHPLAQDGGSSALLNRGPYEAAGDGSCVNANSIAPNHSFDVTYLPGFRHVVDLSNVNESYAVVPGGQSGDPLDKHYNDLTPLWLSGRMHRQYFARTDVVRHSESTLRLLPEPLRISN